MLAYALNGQVSVFYEASAPDLKPPAPIATGLDVSGFDSEEFSLNE